MQILVTGATGFVGFHIARLLVEMEAAVRVLVRNGTNAAFLDREGVAICTGDVRDYNSVRRAMKGCDQVYHAAADYRLWVPDPENMYETNVKGTANVMAAARDLGIERVVYTSTAGTLAPGRKNCPSSETSAAPFSRMVGHYKRSKYLAEREVERFAAEGVPAVIVNPTAPVGPADRKPTPTGKIIVDFMNGKMPAYIDTGLNFAPVRDVARGHWLAAQKGKIGERYLLGGENWALSRFLQSLSHFSGKRQPKIRLPYTPVLLAAWLNDCFSRLSGRCPVVPLTGVRMARHHMYFSSARAERELGYSKTSLTDALEEAVDWYAMNGYIRRGKAKEEKSSPLNEQGRSAASWKGRTV